MTRIAFSSRFHLRSHFTGSGNAPKLPPLFTKAFNPSVQPTNRPASRRPAGASMCHVLFAPWSQGIRDMNQTEPAQCIWNILLTYPGPLSSLIKSIHLGVRPTPRRPVSFSGLPLLAVRTIMLPFCRLPQRRKPGPGKPPITSSSPRQARGADVTQEGIRVITKKGFLADPHQPILLQARSAFAQSQWHSTSHPATPLPVDLSPSGPRRYIFEEAKNIFFLLHLRTHSVALFFW